MLEGDNRWDENYVKINQWIAKEFVKSDSEDNDIQIQRKNSPCQNMALFVNPADRDKTGICKDIAHNFCGTDIRSLKLITIPQHNNAKFVANNGMQLLPGESYCVYKYPPVKNDKRGCDEIWGYWKYSNIKDGWVCHSKVPGIYDAELNKFNPCQREDSRGKFLIDGIEILPRDIPNKYSPSDFHSIEFQSRCSCQCDKLRGFVFNPKLSRSSCYKDPCLLGLPRFAAAEGYNFESKNCNCGEYFTNLFDDSKQPCTACSYERPHYDDKTNTLTIYVKCFRSNEMSDNLALFPCITEEDEERGCRKAVIKVKPFDGKFSDDDFKDRVIW